VLAEQVDLLAHAGGDGRVAVELLDGVRQQRGGLHVRRA